MELNLRGRTALVTGASKGIGRASAEALASEGVDVILVSRTLADLKAARQKKSSITGSIDVQVHDYDLSDSRNVDALGGEACRDVDILVNNAGAIPQGTLTALDEKVWRDSWDLKVFGYINLSRAFYAAMQARGRGVIVNVTGLAGDRLDSGYIAGSTGNAGLNAFTDFGGSAATRWHPGRRL